MCTLIPVKIDLRFMQMLISIKNKPGVMGRIGIRRVGCLGGSDVNALPVAPCAAVTSGPTLA